MLISYLRRLVERFPCPDMGSGMLVFVAFQNILVANDSMQLLASVVLPNTVTGHVHSTTAGIITLGVEPGPETRGRLTEVSCKSIDPRISNAQHGLNDCILPLRTDGS